jgi:hypothetical protein
MATAIPVQRNAITPVPPLSVTPDMNLLAKWLPQLLNTTYKTRLDTQVNAVPNATGTVFLTLPASRGIWLVTCSIGPVGDAVNYQSVGIVAMDGTSSRFVVLWNAPLQSMTILGQNISTSQSSGGTQTIIGTAIQLTHF